MTKTYNDIEAVSRLLEEKERDLELAARIGQTLLSKNKELSARNECLDEQLLQATDKVNQLRHDLSLKEELLRFFNEDLDNESGDQELPVEQPEEVVVNTDFLHKKVDTLENENLTLRLESANLKSATACYEEKEKKLVEDCIKQLAEVNCQVETFAQELAHKAEENEGQREQICKFLGETADLQVKIRKLTVDNMDLHDKLTTSTDSQRMLSKELGQMQDKYDELYEMLEEAHSDLRVMRGKHKVRGTDRHHQNAFNVPTDSLASELEMSLQQELDQSTRRAQSWKIFETARAAKRAVAKVSSTPSLQPASSLSSARALSVSSSAISSSTPALGARRRLRRDSDMTSLGYSVYTSDGESMASDGYTADMDSLYGSNQELGRPGIPGSNDLESALRRLALTRENEKEEEEHRRRLGSLRLEPPTQLTSPTSSTPRIHSPGGLSTPSSSLSFQGYSPCHSAAATLKSSDKLKIMKPLEGSVTLRHWQHLATPHLGGIFEAREGVQMKGERRLDMEEEVVYCLSDFEEDDDLLEAVDSGREATPSTLVHSLIDAAVRSSVSGRDWFDLHDPRTPSPGMAFYNSPSSATFNAKPMQASTPVLNFPHSTSTTTTTSTSSVSSGGINSGSSTPSTGRGVSLGLAALLDSRDSPTLRGSVMRSAVPFTARSAKTVFAPQGGDGEVPTSLFLSSSSSSPAVTAGVVSSTLLSTSPQSVDSGQGSMSSNPWVSASRSSLDPKATPGSILLSTRALLSRYKNLPGSRSLEEMSSTANVKVTVSTSSPISSSVLSTTLSSSTLPSSTSATSSASNSISGDSNSWVFSPDMTGQGFLHQLKNRGYSLYGLWANATAAASSKLSGESSSPSSLLSSNTISNSTQSHLGKSVKTDIMSSTVDATNSNCSNSNGSSNSNGRRTAGLGLLAAHRSTTIDLDTDDFGCNTATTTAITTKGVGSEPGLSGNGGASGGVLGSISGFRRGGLL